MKQAPASKLLYPFLAGRAPKLASSIQKRLNGAGALYLSQELSLADFRDQIRARKIAAVELPPFANEAAPEFLVTDDDLDRIDDLVTKWPSRQPIRLYSTSGGRREHRFNPAGFRADAHYAVSLFPPHLADELIARAKATPSGARILGPNDAFIACAYRAAYLEAGSWERVASEWTAKSDCDVRLLRLAEDAHIALELPVTPKKLDRLLDGEGWRPSIDMLERAAHWMPWIREALPPAEEKQAPGLAVLFLRARAVEAGFQEKIIDCLRDNGFEPLLSIALGEAEASLAAREFRGGNWGRGPYRVSGGAPAAICVALDLLPVEIDDEHRANFPDSDNRRIAEAKNATRDLVNAGVPKPEHYNPVHSTDNSLQAWRVVRAIIPDREQQLNERVEGLRRDFATEAPIRDMTKHGRRAKVELVKLDGEPAIRKTFRPSAMQFMQREIEVMKRLSPLCPEVPRLLRSGENYILMEYVGDGASPPAKRPKGAPPRPLPLDQVRTLAELIKTSVANGFDPIDLRADGNVIFAPSGLKLIDFEFWRPCDPATPPELSMCLSGIPVQDAGNRPHAKGRTLEPYRIGWYPYTLLPLTSFLYDPPSLQRLKRAWNLARAYANWASRSSLSFAKRSARRGLRGTIEAIAALMAPQHKQSPAIP
ncbi:MAG: hypothetical protein ACJ8F4_03255 [Sphingomonas sp.]